MERLALCSRVLYDNDILDKMKEIDKLKKKLKRYETPKVLFNSYEEWENKKKEAIKIIKDGVHAWIESFSNQFIDMRVYELIPSIEKALFHLTNNKEWSLQVSENFHSNITGLCYSITNFAEIRFTTAEFEEIINSHLETQLYDDNDFYEITNPLN